jgi:hypothetical protein
MTETALSATTLAARQNRRDDAMIDRQLAYAILRLTLAVNILLHALVRLPQLNQFAHDLIQSFTKTPLPPGSPFWYYAAICRDGCWLPATDGIVDAHSACDRRPVGGGTRLWHCASQRLGHTRHTDDLRRYLLPVAGEP